jgi:hypothetical protein
VRLEIIPESGVGGQPLQLQASQVVVYGDMGTPFAVIAAGLDGGVEIHYAGQDDFPAVLRRFRINGSVVCDRIVADRPGRALEFHRGD